MSSINIAAGLTRCLLYDCKGEGGGQKIMPGMTQRQSCVNDVYLHTLISHVNITHSLSHSHAEIHLRKPQIHQHQCWDFTMKAVITGEGYAIMKGREFQNWQILYFR